jgi:hypothetical protein
MIEILFCEEINSNKNSKAAYWKYHVAIVVTGGLMDATQFCDQCMGKLPGSKI